MMNGTEKSGVSVSFYAQPFHARDEGGWIESRVAGASSGDPDGTDLAVKAGHALLDQVFINEFDYNSKLTYGICATGGGDIYTPVWGECQGGMEV